MGEQQKLLVKNLNLNFGHLLKRVVRDSFKYTGICSVAYEGIVDAARFGFLE